MVREPGAAVHPDVPCPGFVIWHSDPIELCAVVAPHAGVVVEVDEGALVLSAEVVEAGEELLLL
eukprot:7294829-Heterocapsa_arctica.AAC.1